MTDIFIPELSENIHSGTVTSIAVKTGETVSKGQTLLELETDKAVLEIPSPGNGVVREILIKAGDAIKTGQLAFRFGDDIPSPAEPTPAVSETASAPAAPAPSLSAPSLTPVPGLPETPVLPAPAATAITAAAAPSVRRFAREIGVNINDVPPSGKHDRISLEDVKAYAKARLAARPVPAGAPAVSHPPLPDFGKWGEISREPMSAIRKKTAEHMAYCWSTIPQITQFAKADITGIDQLRQKSSTPNLKLTITPFIVKVIASALKQFPVFNASIDMATREVITKKYYNIGIAVDTPGGLLVPVIKNADQKTILMIASEMQALAEKARARKLALEEMQGGTFTVTNLGGITGGHFTPIPNAPESAILGISRARLEPCYNSGSVCAPRLMLPLSLSYDHRIIDGADGARFIQWIADAIEQPLMLEL